MLLKSTCKIDVTWFPFDEQKCVLTFGSWSFSSKELRLKLLERGSLHTQLMVSVFVTIFLSYHTDTAKRNRMLHRPSMENGMCWT